MTSIDKPMATANRKFCSVLPMGTLQNRIRQAMDLRGVGQSELSRMLDIKQPSVHSLLNSDADRTKYVLDIARVLEVRAEWLQWGTGPMEAASGSSSDVAQVNFADGMLDLGGKEWASIPRFDAALSAGPGAIVDPQAEPLGFHLFEMQWLRAFTRSTPDHLAVVRVAGDSMEPTLRDGDWVLVDRDQTKVNREGIYALAVGDAAWVKRVTLNLREKLIQVISDNTAYPVQELTEEDLCVIGRVVWIVGRKV